MLDNQDDLLLLKHSVQAYLEGILLFEKQKFKNTCLDLFFNKNEHGAVRAAVINLKQSRADNYIDWLKVGFALANASQ